MEISPLRLQKVFFVISSGESYCNDRSKEFSKSRKGIYYYTTYDNHQITAVDMYAENLDSDKLIRYPIILNGEIRWHNK